MAQTCEIIFGINAAFLYNMCLNYANLTLNNCLQFPKKIAVMTKNRKVNDCKSLNILNCDLFIFYNLFIIFSLLFMLWRTLHFRLA